MQDYKDKLIIYERNISMWGGYRSGQCYIDIAYDKLLDAHNKLTNDEKLVNPVPIKFQCDYDMHNIPPHFYYTDGIGYLRYST